MKEETKLYLDFVLKLAALAIALFGVWKFFDERHFNRDLEARKQSLKIIEEYNSIELRRSRKELLDFWLAYPNLAWIVDSYTLPRDGYAGTMIDIFNRYENKEDFYQSLHNISEFFDLLKFCTLSEICNSEIAYSFFCSKAANLDKLFWPFFEATRRQSGFDDFGSGIHQLSAECD